MNNNTHVHVYVEQSKFYAGYKYYSTTITSPNFFKNHFICDGSEKQLSDCILSDLQVNNNLCNGNNATFLTCETGII